jgi:hypothetical protein
VAARPLRFGSIAASSAAALDGFARSEPLRIDGCAAADTPSSSAAFEGMARVVELDADGAVSVPHVSRVF